MAQGVRVPSQGYYAAFADFYDGDYESAKRQFKFEARNAFNSAGRAAGSTPSATRRCSANATMRSGELREALDHYTHAVELVKAYPDWMLRCAVSGGDPGGRPLAAAGDPLGRQHAGGETGNLPAGDDDFAGAGRHLDDGPAGRHRHAAYPGAHRRGRDRALHDAGDPAADEAAGAAGAA